MDFILEITFQGYDVKKISSADVFCLERTLRFDINEWAKGQHLNLISITLCENKNLRPGFGLKIYCDNAQNESVFLAQESEIRNIISKILQPYAKKYFDLESLRFSPLTVVVNDLVCIGNKAVPKSSSTSPVNQAVDTIIKDFQKKYFKNYPISQNIDWQKTIPKLLLVPLDRRADILWDACLIAQKRNSTVVHTEDIIISIEHFLSRDKNIETTDNYISRLAEQFTPLTADCDFDRLVITDKAKEEIELSLVTLNPQTLETYVSWGLLTLDKHPRTVLNFYGPPGTGKTMAANAIANKFGKKIIFANCHSLQSKWHGESSKNVKAVFCAAKKADAILFFDEADSLISQRLEEVNSGSEDEINNMRNTILTCLEEHTGIVIFASNFVKRYDFAFETRIQSVLFPLPDEAMLSKIWKAHLPATIPGYSEIDFELLAHKSFELGFCGRDVKNAVIRASKVAISKQKTALNNEDLLATIQYIFDTREAVHDEPSPIKRNNSKIDATAKTMDEFVAEQKEAFRNNFLSNIVCSEDLDISEFLQRTAFVSDKDIRQIVNRACLIAFMDGRRELSNRDLLAAYDIYRPQRTQEETYDTLMDAIQAIIDKQQQ